MRAPVAWKTIAHDPCNETHERRVEARVQAVLETVDNNHPPPPKKQGPVTSKS
jgi:hypothetical protein